MARWLSCLGGLGRARGGLLRDASGNVLLITAGGLFVMLFAIGFGIDYSRAEMMQTKLNAAADAAVLVAVDPSEIGQSDS
ncbi:MAG TPA: pilus assembly protein TadG-related protein, partial [Novosphingobium sp.]|nr:pilus assembly protein TadG-related protein [Novosphingobium sp.]